MAEILLSGIKVINGVVQVSQITVTSTPVTSADITTQTTDLLAQEQVYSQLLSADETLATNIITLDTKGHRLLDIYAAATTATTFTVDISMDNTNWVNHYTSSAAELKYTSTEWNGFRYIRLTAAVAGVSGTDTVSLMLGSK